MATVAKATISPDTGSLMRCGQITGLAAGEALAAGDACYIKTSDNNVYRCDGSSANAPFDGFVFDAAAIGQAVTLFNHGCRMQYGSGLSGGVRYYLHNSTLGALQDAASTGDTVGVAKSIDTTDIRVIRSA